MNPGGILDTSLLFRYFSRGYGCLRHRLSYIYCNSQTYKVLNKFWEKIKVCFRYSFLGRVIEIKQRTLVILDNSRAVQYLINLYKRWKDRVVCYLKTSLTISLAENTKEELNFSPVKIVSIILVTAVIVNLFLSVFLHKQISSGAWLMRGLFLFVGVAGLFCLTDWPTVRKSSVFFKKIER